MEKISAQKAAELLHKTLNHIIEKMKGRCVLVLEGDYAGDAGRHNNNCNIQ